MRSCDEGLAYKNDGMACPSSTSCLPGVKYESECLDIANCKDIAAEMEEPSVKTISYQSLPEGGPFTSKKGCPLRMTPARKLNGSIQTLDKKDQSPPDAKLIDIYWFETKKPTFEPQETAKLHATDIHSIPEVFNKNDRNINSKLKVLTGPALGYVNAYDEGMHVTSECHSNMHKLRKYHYGIAPLQKLTLLENELGSITKDKSAELSNTYKKKEEVREPPPELSPNLTRREYESIRRQIYATKESRRCKTDVRSSVSNGLDNCLELNQDENEVAFKPNASITVTVPATDFQDDSVLRNLTLASRQSDKEEIDDDIIEFSLTDFATPRSEDERAAAAAEKEAREEKIRLRREKMRQVRERRPLRTMKKDPSVLPGQLPRSRTGEYLVKDYAQRKHIHLFRLNDDESSPDCEVYEPSFRHSKNKLLSKKDKVFLKFTEENAPSKIEVLQDTDDDYINPSTDISVECQSRSGSIETVRSMPSRYATGKETLAEKQLSGEPNQLPGFIKTITMKKQEATSRLPCFVCRNDASYWCEMCTRNYCNLCWNSIGHHEYIDPDEVWNNRKPQNAIEYNPNDERGMSVFLQPNEIHQGVARKLQTPGYVVRPKSPLLQKLDFPPPGGLEGFHSYRGDYDWNTLSKKRVRRKGRTHGQGKHGDQKMNKPRHSDELHDLIVNPPNINVRAPPGLSLTESPIAEKSPLNKTSSGPSTPLHDSFHSGSAVSEDDSITDSISNEYPDNSSGKNRTSIHNVSQERKGIVVMNETHQQTLLWQVAPAGRTLCPVSSFTPGKMTYPAKGILSEFFPTDWQSDREKIRRNFQIFNGVTVATRKISPIVAVSKANSKEKGETS